MTMITLSIEVEINDPTLLIAAARTHSLIVQGTDMGENAEDLGACVQMLLDPGSGGDAYDGPLSLAGFSIIESSTSIG